MSANVLKKIYNFSIYLIGTLVLIAALFATLVRIFLPGLGMYRSEVEAWVSNYMDLPVAIHSMSADWIGWTPHLNLEQIDLMDSTGTSPILLISRAQISIDILSSLLSRQIIPEKLVISGLEITISQLKNGSINIQGLKVEDSNLISDSNNELDNWLLKQSMITIQDANIVWLDELHDQPPLTLSNVNLHLESNLDELIVKGKTSLPADYGSTMEFSIDANGDLLSSNWSAEVFLKANQILPDNWYKHLWPDFLTLTEGYASLSLLSIFEDAKLISFRGNLKSNEFTIYSNEDLIADIRELDTAFSGKLVNSNEWLVNVDFNTFNTANGGWPESNYTINVTNFDTPEIQKVIIEYDYLKIEDLSPFLLSLHPQSGNIIKSLTGEFIDGKILYNATENADNRLLINSGFQNLNPGLTAIEPEIKDISGYISGNLDRGLLSFKNHPAKIIHLQGEDQVYLNGDVEWEKKQASVQFLTDQFSLSNDKINLSTAWKINLSDDVLVELTASISDTNIQNFINYMPYSSSFRSRDWIEHSITSGSLKGFMLSFKGNPVNFPFLKDDGEFIATAEIEDIHLDYSERFPEINNIDANLKFEGLEMLMNVHDGNIFDSNIESATAHIPNVYLREKLLSITGNLSGSTRALKDFINHSPLHNDLLLDTINESLMPIGAINMNLDMTIPIRMPDHQLSLDGNIEFQGAEIVSNNFDLKLSEIYGVLGFTEDRLRSNNMNALYDEQPVVLNISGNKSSASTPAKVSLSGNANHAFFSSQLNKFFPNNDLVTQKIADSLSGNTSWDASINYKRDSINNELQRELVISTDLIGMEVDLPAPLAKKGYESSKLIFSKQLGNSPDNIVTLNYGDITSIFKYNNDSLPHVSHLNITTGDTNAPELKPGINISGNYSALDIKGLVSLFNSNQIVTSDRESLPFNFDLSAKSLHYLGQEFKDVSIQGGKEKNDWVYSIESDSVKGQIKTTRMPGDDFHILADLGHLKLSTNNNNENSDFDPSTAPTIFAQIDKFSYNEMDLGTMSLTAVPNENGLSIEEVSFNKPELQIQASGKWSKNRYTGTMSSFFINVHGNEFNNILETFNFNDNFISRAKTKLIIDANWTGGPADFSLAKLNGTINLGMEKGHLLDIKPAAGRLFGLLSLQTLPRRMILDFSDLFGEGMAFDSITGTFNINEGNAYTDNLTMKGPSVKIDINGRAGLSTQDYDQTAVITPQISDSLAVASGFLGPVGIGFGTVLYLAGNMFEPLQDSINKIMKVEYTIKGSWDDPVIERIDSNKES